MFMYLLHVPFFQKSFYDYDKTFILDKIKIFLENFFVFKILQQIYLYYFFYLQMALHEVFAMHLFNFTFIILLFFYFIYLLILLLINKMYVKYFLMLIFKHIQYTFLEDFHIFIYYFEFPLIKHFHFLININLINFFIKIQVYNHHHFLKIGKYFHFFLKNLQ